MATRQVNWTREIPNKWNEGLVVAAKEGCGFVPLFDGRHALVDEEDLPVTDRYTWSVSDKGYVSGRVRRTIDTKKHHYLHQLVMAAEGDEMVDHKNRNPLDNRKSNLRFCTHQQNQGNAIGKKRAGSTSIYKGVSWGKHNRGGGGKWVARGTADRVILVLGRFDSEIEAARCYDRWALERFGDFALLNGV